MPSVPASNRARVIVTTTPTIEGRRIESYLGLVTGEVILGANAMRDVFAAVTDFFGGRSGQYEQVLARGRNQALDEMEERAVAMGANAVVGIDLDYEVIGGKGSMLMVSVSGTAVRLSD